MSRILVIEDESAIRRVLVKILSEENENYKVEEAEDGLMGLESIKKDDFDLVLCDIKMPKMDGVEVLVAARKIKPEIPFIMISGHGDLDTAVNTMRLGAFDYISKPPDLNRLLTTVRNALDRKDLVVENKILKKKVS
ncbi:MAG TPA: response regulator, partial [Arenibacter sp.]|nr:response regulator [Arenibacter sp.]